MNVLYLGELMNMALTMTGEMIIFMACNPKTTGRSFVVWICILKALFVNFLFGVILLQKYGDTSWYQNWNVIINIVVTPLTCFLVMACTDLSFGRFSMTIILSEWLALCIVFIPAFPLSLLCGQNITYLIKGVNQYHFLCWAVVICLLIVLSLNANRWFAWLRNRQLKHPGFWSVIMIGYAGFGILLTIKNNQAIRIAHEEKEVAYIYPYLYAGTVIVVLGIAAFLFVKMSVRRLALQNENLKMQRAMIKDYYYALRQQIELVRKFRHDIANHLQTVELLSELPNVKTEAIIRYEEVLKKQHRKLATMDYCTNPVIDAAIASKVRYCNKMEIPVEISMSSLNFSKIGIEKIDLLGLLFNLLDNAIESCAKISDQARRHIELQCFQAAGCFVLLMRNSFMEVVEQNHRLVTTKKDKTYHGVGMYIVSDIVKKYDGGMDIRYQQGDGYNDFCIRINLNGRA